MSPKEALLAIQKKFRIENELGIHARPAAQLVKIASQFQSSLLIRKDDREVNGKSIMGVLMLAAACGSEILVTADGPDQEEALREIENLIRNKFGER